MAAKLRYASRILVVDHEPDVLVLLQVGLRAAGYSVSTARDGLEGLQHAQRLMPDLILLETRLPGLDGISACDLLKRLPSTADIPVVILATDPGELARAEALAAGAVDCIGKGLTIHDLLDRIEAALSASHPGQEGDEGGLKKLSERRQFAASGVE